MRLAVTGSTGFIGGHVVRHFAALGHEIVAFGRAPVNPFAALPTVSYRVWDLATGPYVNPPKVDGVVHAAAAVAAWGDYRAFYQANVSGTQHVRASFPDVPHFVHISSASVYDASHDCIGVTEDAPYPQRYLNAYGRTKMLAERALLQDRQPVVILRPRAVYGPGDRTLLPRLLAAARRGWLPVPGNGTNLLSITAIDNLLHAIEASLQYEGPPVVCNIADVDPLTRDALLLSSLHAMGKRCRLVHLPVPTLWALATAMEWAYRTRGYATHNEPILARYTVAQLARTCTLDCTRARDVLGYRPVTTYDAVLPRLIHDMA